MDNKKNGIPKLRFPGFTGAWEQRKLGEIGKVFTGNTPSTKNTENWTTDKSIGHVWITPTDINNNIMFDSERYLSDKGWSQARVVPKNSVLITSIASIGKNAINGVEVAFNQQINALVVQKNNPYFILTLMNKEKQRFESLAGQTATPIINKSTFSSFMVKIPSETEQEQIGEFFKQLDSLIALHQRKLEHLQEQKKGLLQKMFPKNGETVPEVRFPGFTDAWEQRKFSEFATYSGKRNKDNLDLEPYAITSDNGFVRQSEAHNEFGYMKNTDRAAYKIVQSNSFGYNPARINIGSIGYYSGDKNIIVSSLYEVFKTNQDVNDEFLWIWFKSNRFQKWINKLQEGSVRLYFYYDKLRETKIQLPNLEEQRQVADLFTNLDSLIALHQRKLEHLELMKKGLLQQMFV